MKAHQIYYELIQTNEAQFFPSSLQPENLTINPQNFVKLQVGFFM